MTEIKQTVESPQAVPVERPAEIALPAEPAHGERVTKKKAKDSLKYDRCSKRIAYCPLARYPWGSTINLKEFLQEQKLHSQK